MIRRECDQRPIGECHEPDAVLVLRRVLREAAGRIDVVAEARQAVDRDAAGAPGVDHQHDLEMLFGDEIARDPAPEPRTRLPVDRAQRIAAAVFAQFLHFGARADDRALRGAAHPDRGLAAAAVQHVRLDRGLARHLEAAVPPREPEHAEGAAAEQRPGRAAEPHRQSLQPQLRAFGTGAQRVRDRRHLEARGRGRHESQGRGSRALPAQYDVDRPAEPRAQHTRHAGLDP